MSNHIDRLLPSLTAGGAISGNHLQATETLATDADKLGMSDVAL